MSSDLSSDCEGSANLLAEEATGALSGAEAVEDALVNILVGVGLAVVENDGERAARGAVRSGGEKAGV